MRENLTQELLELDIKHLWHPFTQMKIWPDEPPVLIDHAEGNWLVDTDGRRYFDGVSSLWVTVHGHNHPAITKALREQLLQLDHSTLLGLSHEPAVRLASMLARISPGELQHVFYSESGSTAVEIALKMSYQFWQQAGYPEKKTFVALGGAYHGDTLGAVSVGGIELFHEVYRPLLFQVHRLPQPFCRRCPLSMEHPGCGLACAEALDELLKKKANEICAVIVEPLVQGAAGMVIQPDGYLKRLWQIAKKHDVLFIADEVATGFGRTGSMFACEREGVEPDLMALGKGLTGGVLPLAATMTTNRIHDGFLGEYDEFKTFFHGHTYTGNPLTCAAALANISLFEEKGVIAGLEPKIEQLRKGLERISTLDHVLQVRQKGLMAGVEVGMDKAKDKSFPPEVRMGHKVIMACRKHDVIVRPLGDTIVLMPPLSSEPEELDLLLDAVYLAIEEETGR